MNVIVSNKNQLLLENLGIDVIKDMNGEFEVDEIIATFQNFFYQRMILDITAIKNYTDIVNLQKLSISLDMEKVILLLDGTEATSNPIFLSNLVSMGIYNFTKNIEGIQYLYNTPNTYRDVAQFHRLDATFGNAMVANNKQPQQVVTIVQTAPESEFYGTRVIGVKNITKQSGASSLVYMMKNELSKHYSVVGIEVDKTDFNYFRDKNLISTVTSEVGTIINKHKDKNVIIVDINNSIVAEGFCQDVLYLIEPSIIKLQKLMTLNATALQGLKDKKIVLNQSLLSSSDVANFEYEARVKVFYNLVPLNERDNKLSELNKMLVKLGFTKQQSEI
ncbi:MAG: hypothetical protein E7163_05880 [Firmicutes bacterium]|nr:hypothetical protein [Bacillota bacterium]